MEGKISAALCALFVISASSPAAHAVVPYRSPEDYGPSIEARKQLPACRRAAMEAMAGVGKIESESFVQRNEAEYFASSCATAARKY